MALVRSLFASAIIFSLSSLAGIAFEITILLTIISFFTYESLNKGFIISQLTSDIVKMEEYFIKTENTLLEMEDVLQKNEYQLSLTRGYLQDSLDELDRRDAVGTPIVRELMAKQEKALHLQEKAMTDAKVLTNGQEQLLMMQSEGREELHIQNMQIFESLEKILCVNANQNASIQKQIIDENIKFRNSIINSNNELRELLAIHLKELQNKSIQTGLEDLPIVEARPVRYAKKSSSNKIKAM